MRREERVTVQGPVKEQQPDGMSHGGGGGSAKRPKRPRPPVVGETRGRVSDHAPPPPPPAKRACVGLYEAARHGRAGTEDT